jgi:hypothetical protein
MLSRCHGDLPGRGVLEYTFIPSEVPSLKLWFIYLEVLCRSDGILALFGDRELEVGIRLTFASFRAVDRRVNLETDIEVLSGKQICPDTDTSISFAALSSPVTPTKV